MSIELLLLPVLTLTVCLWAHPIGAYLGVMDRPDGQRKRHQAPTPLVGGFAISLPLIVALTYLQAKSIVAASSLLPLCLAAIALALLGFLDDKFNLSAKLRLKIGALICLLWVFVFSLDDPLPSSAFWTFEFQGILIIIVTAFGLLGLVNAVNMTDGVNCLTIGLSIFWCACLLLYGDPHFTIIAAVVLMASIILFPFNFYGKLFLGDSGSYLIGALIGIQMIHAVANTPQVSFAICVAVWLSVPVLDCLRVMFARVLAGLSPLQPDRNHYYHRLIAYLDWRWGVGVCLILTYVPGGVTLVWPEVAPIMFVTSVALYGVVIWVTGAGACTVKRLAIRILDFDARRSSPQDALVKFMKQRRGERSASVGAHKPAGGRGFWARQR